MLKNIVPFAIFILITLKISAQEKIVIENNDDYQFQSEKNKTTQTTVVKKKVYTYQPSWSFGGNLGMAFWNSGTDIFLAPKAYYHVSPKFITGIGVTYIYSDGQYWSGNIIGYENFHSNAADHRKRRQRKAGKERVCRDQTKDSPYPVKNACGL